MLSFFNKLQFSKLSLWFVLFFTILIFPNFSRAIEDPASTAAKSAVFTQLGSYVDTSLELTNSKGKKFTISELLDDGKPLIIVPVYYTCPRLCGLVLGGVAKLISEIELKIGNDYRVLAASFDVSDNQRTASNMSFRFRESAGLTIDSNLELKDWVFSFGDEKTIPKLMNQIGFKYLKDGEEFAHSAAMMVLTPEGKISQFFTGIDFSAWDVKLSLVEASEGKIGSTIDQIYLFCFRFDPTKGKYTWAAWNFARIGSLLFVVCFFSTVLYIIRKKNINK